MARINVGGGGHGNKSEVYAGGMVVHYFAFPTSAPKDAVRLAKVQRAFDLVNKLDKTMGLASVCNAYFTHLAKGRTFHHFWWKPSIFVNYDPVSAAGTFGATHTNDRDIALNRWCIDHHNHWMIAATIVHEFAHIGGAPGGGSVAAEGAVKACRFGPQYDPHIHGSLQRLLPLLQRLS